MLKCLESVGQRHGNIWFKPMHCILLKEKKLMVPEEEQEEQEEQEEK